MDGAESNTAPWLDRADWAAGRIQSSGRRASNLLWLLAIVFNLVAWPLAVAAGSTVIFMWLFPLAGCYLLYSAIRTTVGYAGDFDIVLEMSSVPAPIGGVLEARIVLDPGRFANQSFQATLTCARNSRSNSQEGLASQLWEDQQSITVDPDGLLRISINIPENAEETGAVSVNYFPVYWKLEVASPATHYAQFFMVPVYRVKLTPDQKKEVTLVQTRRLEQSESFQLPADSPITVRALPEGGTEFYFPSGRCPGPALILFLVGLLFTVGALYLPWFFGLIFFSLGSIMLYAFLRLVFGTIRVVVSPSKMDITRRLFGMNTGASISVEAFDRIEVEESVKMGHSIFYNQRVICRDGKFIDAGTMIGSKLEAESLAGQMRQCLLGKA